MSWNAPKKRGGGGGRMDGSLDSALDSALGGGGGPPKRKQGGGGGGAKKAKSSWKDSGGDGDDAYGDKSSWGTSNNWEKKGKANKSSSSWDKNNSANNSWGESNDWDNSAASSSRNKVQIKRKPRFFDSYADIANTHRVTLELPDYESELPDFEWRCAPNDGDPVIIYDAGGLEAFGVATNSRILQINDIDSGVMSEDQVRELFQERPLKLRVATRKDHKGPKRKLSIRQQDKRNESHGLFAGGKDSEGSGAGGDDTAAVTLTKPKPVLRPRSGSTGSNKANEDGNGSINLVSREQRESRNSQDRESKGRDSAERSDSPPLLKRRKIDLKPRGARQDDDSMSDNGNTNGAAASSASTAVNLTKPVIKRKNEMVLSAVLPKKKNEMVLSAVLPKDRKREIALENRRLKLQVGGGPANKPEYLKHADERKRNAAEKWLGKDRTSNTNWGNTRNDDNDWQSGQDRKATLKDRSKRFATESGGSGGGLAMDMEIEPSPSDDYDEDEEESDSEQEAVVTIGPVTGKSRTLEKSYLRLTEDAKASDVRPISVLREAFARLLRIYGSARDKKGVNSETEDLIYNIQNAASSNQPAEKKPTWWYVSDQLRAIRQDCLVQNIESRFVSKVYAQNAAWAIRESDLGQFHQCCMQLKVLATKPDPQHPGEVCVSEADREEFLILRGVYNCFMGLDHIPDDRLNHPKHYQLDWRAVEDDRMRMEERAKGEGNDGDDPDSNGKDGNANDSSSSDDDTHPLPTKTRFQPVIELLNAYREKNFALYFRLRKRCIPESQLDNLCGVFDDMFRCYFMRRIAKSFKTEAPNISLYTWMMRFRDRNEFLDFCERAQIDIVGGKGLGKVKTQVDLIKAIDESPKINIRHAMR